MTSPQAKESAKANPDIVHLQGQFTRSRVGRYWHDFAIIFHPDLGDIGKPFQ